DEIGGTASQIDTSTHISGFTIQNGGNGWYAGGIYLQWAGPTLTDLDIKDNNGTRGGGIHLSWSWPIIQNVIIRDNQASEYGGGLSSHMTTCGIDRKAILENVIITGNSAYNYGGGMHSGQGSVVEMSNTLIADNEAGVQGGGLYITEWSLFTLDGVTVANNTAPTGAGLYLYAGGDATITNSIVVDNIGDAQVTIEDYQDAVAIIDISYSNFEGGESGVNVDNSEFYSILWGDGNIDVDSRFVSVIEGEEDYHLLASSLCINSGHPDSTDSDGTRADIGAYPYLNNYNGSVGWYVSADAGDDVAGWGHPGVPFASIQAALNATKGNPELYETQTINVEAGTYYENIEWPVLVTSDIKLYG
ncbi:uncharacterized protein METZ01_LOCUS320327, partial [marine metagenome]